MDLNHLLHQHQLALLLAGEPMSVKDKRASAEMVNHYEAHVRDYRERLGLAAYRRNASLIDMNLVFPEPVQPMPPHSANDDVADFEAPEASVPAMPSTGGEPARLETLADLGIVHRIVDIYEIGGVSHRSLSDALAHARRLKRN